MRRNRLFRSTRWLDWVPAAPMEWSWEPWLEVDRQGDFSFFLSSGNKLINQQATNLWMCHDNASSRGYSIFRKGITRLQLINHSEQKRCPRARRCCSGQILRTTRDWRPSTFIFSPRMARLGKDPATKSDEFLEKFQTAFDIPPSFLENYIAIFYNGYGRIYARRHRPDSIS